MAVPAPSGEGGGCGDVQKCQPGLHCASGLCQPLKSSGACASTRECAADRTCAFAPALGTSACVPFAPLAGACASYPASCFLSDCGAAGACVHRPVLGERCVDGTVELECGDGWCDAGVCAPYTPVGQTCTSAVECGPVASCIKAAGATAATCTAFACAEP